MKVQVDMEADLVVDNCTKKALPKSKAFFVQLHYFINIPEIPA